MFVNSGVTVFDSVCRTYMEAGRAAHAFEVDVAHRTYSDAFAATDALLSPVPALREYTPALKQRIDYPALQTTHFAPYIVFLPLAFIDSSGYIIYAHPALVKLILLHLFGVDVEAGQKYVIIRHYHTPSAGYHNPLLRQ